MKVILIIVFFFSLIEAKEPSAFELQSGSTKKEMQILKSQNEQQSDKIFELENKIKQLETSLEGFKSIYEGQTSNIKEISDKVNLNNNLVKEDDIKNLQEQISNNTKNIQLLKDSLIDISDSTNKIQEILSDELERENNSTKSLTTTKIQVDNNKTNAKTDTTKISKEDSSIIKFDKDITRRGDIFKKARSLAYAKKFDEAIARYKWFIEIDYKKAETNYMLGNIAYEQNYYSDAIFYYKESALLDDKASYMPRLLLNSANSFRVINDVENARNFYNSLLSLFPDSNEAKEAKKQVEKLK